MGAFFSALIAKIAGAVGWIGSLFVKVFTALWDLLRDAVCWPFEQLLEIVVGALGEIDVSALDGYASQAGALGAEILNVLGLLGVGTAVGIIIAAIGIRLVLQLIPFTRLGS